MNEKVRANDEDLKKKKFNICFRKTRVRVWCAADPHLVMTLSFFPWKQRESHSPMVTYI